VRHRIRPSESIVDVCLDILDRSRSMTHRALAPRIDNGALTRHGISPNIAQHGHIPGDRRITYGQQDPPHGRDPAILTIAAIALCCAPEPPRSAKFSWQDIASDPRRFR
jgi:hypothetical protein